MEALTVRLPHEQEQQIYTLFVGLAKQAIQDAMASAKTNDRYYNQKELCRYFSCGASQIREWQKQGLKSFRRGKEVMFDIEDVHEFLNTKKY